MRKRNKFAGLVALVAGCTMFNPLPPTYRHYWTELINEIPSVVDDIFTNNGYQPREGELLADLHVHFLPVEMHGGIETFINDLMGRADIVAITDRAPDNVAETTMSFNQLKGYLEDLGGEYNVESDDRAIQITKGDKTLYLLRAQEVLTEQKIEVVVVGATKQFSRYSDIAELISTSHADGAITIMAHPMSAMRPYILGRFVLPNAEELETRLEYAQKVTAIEVFNAQNTHGLFKSMVGSNILARRAVDSLNIPGVASSDGHYAMNNVGLAGTLFLSDDLDFTNGNTLIDSMRKAIENKQFQIHTEYNSTVNFVWTVARSGRYD